MDTIIAVAERIGQPTTCPSSGGKLFGGHSLRTGGAQTLAGLGVDPLGIQAMGRWKSQLVIRYAGDKGASGITRDMRRGLQEAARSSTSWQPCAEVGLGVAALGASPGCAERLISSPKNI